MRAESYYIECYCHGHAVLFDGPYTSEEEARQMGFRAVGIDDFAVFKYKTHSKAVAKQQHRHQRGFGDNPEPVQDVMRRYRSLDTYKPPSGGQV